LRVLLVEDNPGDVELIRTYLARFQPTSVTVENVGLLSLALQIVVQRVFDVAIVDLKLPDAQGTEAIDALHIVASNVPIVVLTQLQDEELAFKCIDAGAQDFLYKDDLHENTLRRAIRFAIRRHRESQEKMMLLRQLEATLTKVLSGYVTICMHCKQIRVGSAWQSLESYVEHRSNAKFTHSVCPGCVEAHYPEYAEKLGPQDLGKHDFSAPVPNERGVDGFVDEVQI
jgi:DNA-binding response OmpR family regulator